MNEIWLVLSFVAGAVCMKLGDVLFDGIVDSKVRDMTGPPRPTPPPPMPSFEEWKTTPSVAKDA